MEDQSYIDLSQEQLEEQALSELMQALLLIKNEQELGRFLKDLCTPQELRVLAERWRVCKLLNAGDLSYRQINIKTGASLATIGRVARFLKDEPYHGYRLVLGRMSNKNEK